jgi:hypothetical protein
MTHQEAADTLAVERYLLDEMSDEHRQTFEEHYFQCEICADDLRVATAMLQGAREGFASASTAGNVVAIAAGRSAGRKPGWYRSVALPWAVAATLAVVAGYQSLWVAPSLRQGAPPLALTPVTLRPQSRGAEAVIPVGAHGGPTALAIEINEPPQAGEVTYDLSSADGRHIVSGRALAPAPGSPLLLLMPSWTLVAPMHYILSIHDAAGTGRLLGEYRLTVPAQ